MAVHHVKITGALTSDTSPCLQNDENNRHQPPWVNPNRDRNMPLHGKDCAPVIC